MQIILKETVLISILHRHDLVAGLILRPALSYRVFAF